MSSLPLSQCDRHQRPGVSGRDKVIIITIVIIVIAIMITITIVIIITIIIVIITITISTNALQLAVEATKADFGFIDTNLRFGRFGPQFCSLGPNFRIGLSLVHRIVKLSNANAMSSCINTYFPLSHPLLYII